MENRSNDRDEREAPESDATAGPGEEATFRSYEARYWANWLPEDLSDRLEKIKKLVEQLIINHEDNRQLAYYTPHGIGHFRAVEDNFHRLIPNNYHNQLGESEKFFLLASAWLHDLGMIRGIFGDTKDDTMRDAEIRNRHHVRSQDYIERKYKSIGVTETEASVFGWLAYYHRRRTPIEECPREITLPVHGKIRVRLLAAYLRLADALHIDNSRTPAGEYAIMLTYSIPAKDKLHWLRSKFVLGVDLDIRFKTITIHFRTPISESIDMDRTEVGSALESIYDLIIKDLEDEINSIKNVLFDAKLTYFLRIRKKIHEVPFSNFLINDFKEVLPNFYQLYDNPSSSALYSLVLQSIKSMMLSYESASMESTDKIITNIQNFISEIETNVLRTRACHTGLKNLVDGISDQLKACKWKKGNFIACFCDWIDRKIIDVKFRRRALRIQAKLYFDEQILVAGVHLKKRILNYYRTTNRFVPRENPDAIGSDDLRRRRGSQPPRLNILLYGFSELTIKTICGFRDSIIELLKSLDLEMKDYEKAVQRIVENNFMDESEQLKSINEIKAFYHQHDLEEQASDFFNLFCCEGQPKNHTSAEGTLIYHDGLTYAKALHLRKFKNIHVIPDAVSGSLTSNSGQNKRYPQIDFIIVGANGFTKNHFIHSAGHSMVISSALFNKQNMVDKASTGIPDRPNIILSLLTDKYSDSRQFPGTEEDDGMASASDDLITRIVNVDGWKFKKMFTKELSSRIRPFFCQDPKIKKQLQNNNDILFYNPRQDSIEINMVDTVITERAYHVKADFYPQDFCTKKQKGKSPGELIRDGKKLTKESGAQASENDPAGEEVVPKN